MVSLHFAVRLQPLARKGRPRVVQACHRSFVLLRENAPYRAHPSQTRLLPATSCTTCALAVTSVRAEDGAACWLRNCLPHSLHDDQPTSPHEHFLDNIGTNLYMSHGWRSGGPAETRVALWWRWTIVVAVWRTDSILFYVLKIRI